MDTVISKPLASDLNVQEYDEYIALASRIGMSDHPCLVEAELRKVLHDEHIRVYDTQQVEKYLDRVFPGIAWKWVPLRVKDQFPGWVESERAKTNRREAGSFSLGLYAKPVPLPVLVTIDKILTKVPQVTFYVSDESPQSFGDPFLLCRVPGIVERFYVIEKWDEPSYREK